MSDPNNKLDFSAITFDSVVGDGAEGLETVEAPQDVEEVSDDIIDEDPREYGDEDFEDGVDEYESDDEDYSVEDDYDDDEEEYDDDDEDDDDEFTDEEYDDLPIADKISDILGVETEYEYADTVEGLTNYVRDVSEDLAEDQLQELFEQYPEVQAHLDFVLAGGDPQEFYAANNPSGDYSRIQWVKTMWPSSEQCLVNTRQWATQMSLS